MVTKAQRLNRQLLESLDPIVQPLKNVVLFVAAAAFFWWIAEQCLGEHLPDISNILPAEMFRFVRTLLR